MRLRSLCIIERKSKILAAEAKGVSLCITGVLFRYVITLFAMVQQFWST